MGPDESREVDGSREQGALGGQTALVRQMERAWQLPKEPPGSQVPIIGPVVSFFWRAWTRCTTGWKVEHLVEQQNQYNKLVLELAREVGQVQIGLVDRDRRVEQGFSDRDRRIQARFEMLDQLIDQQADLIADRGMGISSLAAGVSRLSMRVEELERLVQEAAEDEPA